MTGGRSTCEALAAFATILDEQQQVLLVHRRDIDVWECPGGGVGRYESPWDTTVRETYEETGLEVSIEAVAGVYWRPSKPALVFQFLGRVIAGLPRPTDKADDVRYFASGRLPPRISPVVRERVLDSITTPGIFRTQQGPGAKDFIDSYP